MNVLDRLMRRTEEKNVDLLTDLLETAKYAILARLYPFHNYPTNSDGEVVLDARYLDLQLRIALDLYNKMGAEGEVMHTENGITRTYQSSCISEQLLSEVTPFIKLGGT